jgi:hypothetical protein
LTQGLSGIGKIQYKEDVLNKDNEEEEEDHEADQDERSRQG